MEKEEGGRSRGGGGGAYKLAQLPRYVPCVAMTRRQRQRHNNSFTILYLSPGGVRDEREDLIFAKCEIACISLRVSSIAS